MTGAEKIMKEALTRLSTLSCIGDGDALGLSMSEHPIGRELLARRDLAMKALSNAADARDLTNTEEEAIAKLQNELGLSRSGVLRQALRLYQMHHERLKAGETCTYSGDAQRAAAFAGPLLEKDA